MIKKVRKVGNSHVITLDKAIMEQMGLREGSEVNVQLDGRNAVVSPAMPRVKDEEVTAALADGMKRYDDVLRRLA